MDTGGPVRPIRGKGNGDGTPGGQRDAASSDCSPCESDAVRRSREDLYPEAPEVTGSNKKTGREGHTTTGGEQLLHQRLAGHDDVDACSETGPSVGDGDFALVATAW